MPFVPFYEKFPEIAKEETRNLHVLVEGGDLPRGDYALLELYCDEPDCDCRRVFFYVSNWKNKKHLAVITYGWASKKFYSRWMRGNATPEELEELKGPCLNRMSPQSKFAPAMLKQMKIILQDREYIDRIKRHYRMFREAVDEEHEADSQPLLSSKSASPNDPCPCGSGKKYKKCCME